MTAMHCYGSSLLLSGSKHAGHETDCLQIDAKERNSSQVHFVSLCCIVVGCIQYCIIESRISVLSEANYISVVVYHIKGYTLTALC